MSSLHQGFQQTGSSAEAEAVSLPDRMDGVVSRGMVEFGFAVFGVAVMTEAAIV